MLNKYNITAWDSSLYFLSDFWLAFCLFIPRALRRNDTIFRRTHYVFWRKCSSTFNQYLEMAFMIVHLISYTVSHFWRCYLLLDLIYVEYYIVGCRFIVGALHFFTPHFFPVKTKHFCRLSNALRRQWGHQYVSKYVFRPKYCLFNLLM